MPPDDTRLIRIETKVDALAESMILLARVDERLAAVVEKQAATDCKIEKIAARAATLEEIHQNQSPIINVIKFVLASLVVAFLAFLSRQK